MYNLNQSYGMGYITLMDWKSLEMAGVGNSKVLKQTIIDTAVELGKIKKGDITIGTFSSKLKDKWADQEVIEKSFAKYAEFSQAVYKEMEEHPDLYEDTADAIEKMSKKYNSLGVTAFKAAQECKTFSEAIDYTKDAIGSQFSEIFKAIFGDYSQAKELWSNFANKFLYPVFVEPLEKLKTRVQEIMKFNPFKSLADKLKDKGIGEFAKKVKNISKSLEYYQKMVTSVWRGDWKNQPFRQPLLEGKGHNYKVIQTLVNKGYLYKLTVDDVAAAEKKYGIVVEETTTKVKDLSDAELKKAGLTEEEIKLYRDLEAQSKKTGKSMKQLINEMSGKDVRTLLVEGVYNFGKIFLSVLDSIKKAWSSVFRGPTLIGIWNSINAFNKFSETLKNKVEKNADNLVRTLKGLFSILHIITSFIGGGFKIAFTILKTILSMFNMDMLEFTAWIGDSITALDQWLTRNNLLIRTIKIIVPWIMIATQAVKDWIEQNEFIQSSLKAIKGILNTVIGSIDSWFKGLGEAENVPEYIFGGLLKGIQYGAKKVFEAFSKFAEGIIQAVCDVLQIHSPSKVFIVIGGFIVAGLIYGIKDKLPELWSVLSGMGEEIQNVLGSIDWNKIFALAMLGGLLYATKKISDSVMNIVNLIGSPLKGVQSLLTGLGTMFKQFGEARKIKAMGQVAESVGKSLIMIAGALLIVSMIPSDKLLGSAIALGAMGIAITALTYALVKISKLSGKSMAVVKITSLLAGLSLSMLAMAVAMKVVSGIEDMTSAIVGLIAMVGSLSLLIAALGLLFKNKKSLEDAKQVGKMIKKIAWSLLIMVGVMKLASMLTKEEVDNGTEVIGRFIGFIVVLGVAARIAGKNADKAGKMIGKVAFSLLIMIGVMKLASTLTEKDLEKGIAVMTMCGIFFGALMAVSALAGQNAGKAGFMFVGISLALLSIVAAMKIMSGLSESDIQKGIAFLTVFGIFCAALIAVSALAGQHAAKAGAMLLMMSASLLILVGVLYILTLLKPDELWESVGIVTVLEILFGGLIAVSHLAGENAVKVINKLMVALVLMVASLIVLTFIDSDKLLRSTLSLSAVMSAFALMITSTSKINGKKTKTLTKTLLLFTGVLLAIGGIITVMSLLGNPQGMIPAALSLSIVMIALVGLMNVVNKMKINKSTMSKVVKVLYELSGVVSIIGAIIGLISYIGNSPATVITSAAAISITLVAMAGVMAALGALGKIKMDYKSGIIAMYALSGVVAIIGLILGLMSNLTNPTGAIASAIAISGLLVAMTAVIAVLALIGNSAAGITVGLTAMYLLIPVIAALGIIIGLMSNFGNPEGAIQSAISLSALLIAMSASLAILAVVGLAGPAALIGIASLIAIIVALGALFIAVGALMEKFPQLEELLNKGIPVMCKIMEGIGKMFGSLVAGFAEGVMQSLPALGLALSQFAINSMPFVMTMKMVDEQCLKGVGILTLAILALTAADFINGIAQILPFCGSMSDLGKDLSNFAINCLPFLATMLMINPAMATGVEALCNAILKLTMANLLDGIASFLSFGSSSLEEFGEQLPILGTCMKDFMNNIGTFGKEQLETTTAVSKGILALADAADKIPGQSGFWQGLFGEHSLSTFGDQIKDLGTSLKSFVNGLDGFDSKNLETVKVAAQAIVELGKAADKIPGQGGFWQKLFGEKNFAVFGAQLPVLGRGISGFISELGKFSEDKLPTVRTACEAIKILCQVSKELPDSGGWWQKIFGEKNFEDFAKQLPMLGKGIQGFVNALGVFGNDQLSSVDAACKAMKIVVDLSNIDVKGTGEGLKTFGNNISDYANKLKDFTEKVNKIDSGKLSDSVSKAKELISVAKTITAADVQKTSTFSATLKNLGNDGVKKFVEAFSGESPKKQALDGINKLLNQIINGAYAKRKAVYTEFRNVAQQAIYGLFGEDVQKKVNDVGLWFVQGFANGVKNNANLAYNAAYSVGQTAVQGSKDGTNSHSPSKEAEEVGKFFDLGFIKGINELSRKVYNSSYNVGEQANNGLSNAISKISNFINADMDVQPTIRPVMDLSNIQNGVGTINSMFGNSSYGLEANLNAISSGINSKIQNGKNSDVIGAINSLRDGIGNSKGDTYNVNGITYDDGTNIAEAVKTLIHAAKIERRR